MKKWVAVALVVVAVIAVMRLNAGYMITGSKHDFTRGYTDDSGKTYTASNKCSICHAAHKAKRISPLWSRDNPTDTGWIVWNGQGSGRALNATTTDGYLTASDFVASGSGMCMSCHDGQTAIGSGSSYVYMRSAFRGNWGRDLRDMHPVGKMVPFGTAGWQRDLASGNAASGSNVATDTNGTVGCISCHSMHSSFSSHLLRAGERCLSCHNK